MYEVRDYMRCTQVKARGIKCVICTHPNIIKYWSAYHQLQTLELELQT